MKHQRVGGDKHYHGGGKKGARRPSGLLRDMRAVYGQAPEQDKLGAQAALRQLFTDDPKAFLAQLAQLERAHRAGSDREQKSSASARPEKPVCRDGGTECVLDLIERILGEYDQEDRDTRAKEGRCLTCGRPAVGATVLE